MEARAGSKQPRHAGQVRHSSKKSATCRRTMAEEQYPRTTPCHRKQNALLRKQHARSSRGYGSRHVPQTRSNLVSSCPTCRHYGRFGHRSNCRAMGSPRCSPPGGNFGKRTDLYQILDKRVPPYRFKRTQIVVHESDEPDDVLALLEAEPLAGTSRLRRRPLFDACRLARMRSPEAPRPGRHSFPWQPLVCLG